MAYKQYYTQTSTALGSAVMCLDGVPFKIGDKFKCPVVTDLTYDVSANINMELLSKEYPFTTENAVLKWVEDLKQKETLRNKVEEQVHLTKVKFNNDEQRKKSVGAQPSKSNTTPMSKTALPVVPPKAKSIKSPKMQDLSTNHIVHPSATFRGDLLQPVSVLPPNSVQIVDGINGTVVDKLDISQFEKVDDPFENMELQTINDMEVLKNVLDHPVNGDRVNYADNTDQINHVVNSDQVNHTVNSDQVNHSDQSLHTINGHWVNHTVKGDQIHHTVNGDQINHTVNSDQLTVVNGVIDCSEMENLSTTWGDSEDFISVTTSSSTEVQNINNCEITGVVEQSINGDKNHEELYENSVSKCVIETNDSTNNVNGDLKDSCNSNSNSHAENLPFIATSPPLPAIRRKSENQIHENEQLFTYSNVTTDRLYANENDDVTNEKLSIEKTQSDLTNDSIITDVNCSDTNSGVVVRPAKSLPDVSHDVSHDMLPAVVVPKPPVPVKTFPRPLSQQRLDAISPYITTKKTPKPAPRLRKMRSTPSPSHDLINPKREAGSDGPDIPPRTTSLLVDSNPTMRNKPLPPTPTSSKDKSHTKATKCPPRPARKSLPPLPQDHDSWNHFNPLPTTAAMPKINNDPYNRMSVEAKTFIDNLEGLGFPRARIARAVERFGQDDKIVVEHLCLVNKLSDQGYKCGQAEMALHLYCNNYDQASKYLELFKQFQELGFSTDKIRDAIYNTNIDRDKALDVLTMSS